MVGFELNSTFLMLDPATVVGIERVNSILEPGFLPGDVILSVRFPKVGVNQMAFGFAEELAITTRTRLWEDVHCYLHNILWQRGTLKLRDVQPDYYEMSFHTGNGELQLKLENRMMPGLNLGTEAVDLQTVAVYPTVNHIFFPLKNIDFYFGNNDDFKGYVNYYNGGAFATNATTNDYNRVPFPFLLYVLDKTFVELGYYGIAGTWTTDADIKKVVIYNNYSLDELTGALNTFSSDVVYNRHVPNVSIGDFIIDVAIFFGIMFVPNEKTGYVDIVRIKDVLNATAFSKVTAGRDVAFSPNEADGYLFRQMQDDMDVSLEKNKDWLTEEVGNEKELVETQASTVNTIDETDTINARDWVIPEVQQPGVSAAFDLGIDNRAPLRFMIYNGEQDDSLSDSYPQGSYATPTMSLRWEGTEGLVATNYTEWMAFKDKTIAVERELRMTITDFLTMDIAEQVMADRLKYLFGRVSAEVSFANGIGAVQARMYKV
jgi:hypothetical protein